MPMFIVYSSSLSDITYKNGTPIVSWSINRRAKIQNAIKKI